MARPFKDTVVIYFDEVDQVWIGHSLQTDQVGVGDRIVEALAGVLKAVHQVVEAGRKDRTIQIFRKAPREVQALARTAKKLPAEIYEIAHKMVHGEWPEEWEPPVLKSKGVKRFTAAVESCEFA